MKKILVLTLAAIIMLSASCSFGTKPADKEIVNVNKETEDNIKDATSKVTLYYTDKDASYLCAEVREVPADKADDASFVVNELLKGTDNKELVNVIPKGTRVNSVAVEDGLCTLDLSADFISSQGTANEQMSIYSVVNTLCLLDSVDSVRFLIDGKAVMIFGSYIFDEPFTEDNTIVR